MLRSFLLLCLACMVPSLASAQAETEISVSKLQNLSQVLQEDLQSGRVEGAHTHLLQLQILLDVLQQPKEPRPQSGVRTVDPKTTYAKVMRLTIDPNEPGEPNLTAKLIPLGQAVQAALDQSDFSAATNQANQLRKALSPIRSAQLDFKVRQSFAAKPDSGAKDLLQHVYNLSHALHENDLEAAKILTAETLELLEHPDTSISEMKRRGTMDGLIADAKYLSYSALGRIAVQNADYDNAQKYLLASAVGPKASHSIGFGPNMKLAQALLQHGYKDTVLQYLTVLKSYWDSPKPEEWINNINNGQMPSFGANLLYH